MYEDEVDFSKIEELLPKPAGYRLLVALPKVQEKTKGDILKPESYIKLEEAASIVALVITVGPDAYADTAKFPNGPWCKQGDWVMIRSYAGTRFLINDEEYRLINDDTIDGVVPDPRAIARVGAIT